MTDYFVLPTGEELNPWFIDIQVYKEAVWVEQYEVIQEREDTILLRVVLPQGKSLKELESLHVHLQEKLGDDVKLKVEAVREIEPGQSGKYFYHRSLVQGAYARTYE